MKGIFTIGMDRRFVDELAAGVLAEHGDDPLALAERYLGGWTNEAQVPVRHQAARAAARASRRAIARSGASSRSVVPDGAIVSLMATSRRRARS